MRPMRGNSSQRRRPTDDQRTFFEALMVMRERYASRGNEDATAVIGVHHAIALANTALANSPMPARSRRTTAN